MRIIIGILLCGIGFISEAQIDTIQWIQLSPLPDSNQRYVSGYFLIDSDFYVVGGEVGDSYSTLSTVWRYYIPSDNWIQMGNLPFGGAACGGCFVLNGKGYFLTARDSVSNGDCDTLFWEYDPAQDSWAQKASFPDAPRQGESFFSYGGKGYVGQTYGCQVADSHFWEYDPILNNWSQVAALPDKVYLIGGSYTFGGDVGDIWRYDILNNNWDSIGQMPGMAREGAIFWGFDSVIIGGGGVSSNMDTDFYIYNMSYNIWAPVVFENSFDSAAAGGTFIFNKRAYYFGGISSYSQALCSNQMWSFDASKYLTDTSVGIKEIRPDVSFSVYPNPVVHDESFSISTSESGEILFYDALGRQIDDRKLTRGINQVKLDNTSEVVFYKATLQYGAIENGKIVVVPGQY